MTVHKAQRRILVTLASCVAVTSLALSSCTSLNQGARQFEGQFITGSSNDPYREARADNLNRHVSQEFNPTPEIIADLSGSGVEVSQKFFTASDTVVISSGDVADQVRAASVAVVSHAPMLIMTDETRAEVVAEISRLKATYVLEVGDVPLASGDGAQRRIKDPGGIAALGELTALQFYPKAITYPTAVIQAVAALDPDDLSYLIPGWDEEIYQEAIAQPSRRDTSRAKLPPFPGQSKRDAGMAPLVIASEQSSVAAVATAKAYGATVRSMRYPDPRFSTESMKMVAGLADQPLIALGSQFGTAEQLSQKIRLGEKVTTAIAGGGGLVFPGRTIVVVDANSYSGTEVLTETGAEVTQPNPAEGLAQHAKSARAEIARLIDGNFSSSVIVDFGTVQQHFSNNDMESGTPDKQWEEKRAELSAITDAGGYGIISLTPVSGELTRQLAALSTLLENPNVGIMLNLSQAAAEGTGISVAVTQEDRERPERSHPESEPDTAPEYAPADPRVESSGFAGSGRSDEGTTPRDLQGTTTRNTGVNPESIAGDVKLAITDADTEAQPPLFTGPVVLTAHDINLASGWISRFVENNDLPQKAFILGQSAPGMVTDRAVLKTTSPNIAFTVLTQPMAWEDAAGISYAEASKRYRDVVSDYEGLRKEIFFGWGVSDIAGAESAVPRGEVAANIVDFIQLSPRPWLIINN